MERWNEVETRPYQVQGFKARNFLQGSSRRRGKRTSALRFAQAIEAGGIAQSDRDSSLAVGDHNGICHAAPDNRGVEAAGGFERETAVGRRWPGQKGCGSRARNRQRRHCEVES